MNESNVITRPNPPVELPGSTTPSAISQEHDDGNSHKEPTRMVLYKEHPLNKEPTTDRGSKRKRNDDCTLGSRKDCPIVIGENHEGDDDEGDDRSLRRKSRKVSSEDGESRIIESELPSSSHLCSTADVSLDYSINAQEVRQGYQDFDTHMQVQRPLKDAMPGSSVSKAISQGKIAISFLCDNDGLSKTLRDIPKGEGSEHPTKRPQMKNSALFSAVPQDQRDYPAFKNEQGTIQGREVEDSRDKISRNSLKETSITTIVPSYNGIANTPESAELLICACVQGLIPYYEGFPESAFLPSLASNGIVTIYRYTTAKGVRFKKTLDGKTWSRPSRNPHSPGFSKYFESPTSANSNPMVRCIFKVSAENGYLYHLVAYSNTNESINDRFPNPLEDTSFQKIEVCLTDEPTKQNGSTTKSIITKTVPLKYQHLVAGPTMI